MTELYGRKLAEEAHHVLKQLDPDGNGVHVEEIERELERRGHRIRGDNPRQLIGYALNGNQDLAARVGRSTWSWRVAEEWHANPRAGLSGLALAEEAYRVAGQLDPERNGIHYTKILGELLLQHVKIRGANAGQTLVASLRSAPRLFEPMGRGVYRTK